MELFDRQVRVAIGESGGSGFEIGAAAANGMPLHIKFSFEKADVESPNTGKLTVWNLNGEHLAELEKQDCRVCVYAGYGRNLSQVFAGTVTYMETSGEGADQMTEIEVADGMAELRDASFSVAYAEGTDTGIIYQEVAEQIGLPISSSPSAMDQSVVLRNGLSFVGEAKNLLKRLSRMDGTAWTIQDGILQIMAPGEPISLDCYELNAKSGLIGMPKRINVASSSGSARGSDGGKETASLGWEVKYLMNLAIGVNSYVHLTSKAAVGYFRVQKVAIEGDNYDGGWQCTATLMEVKGQ